MSYGLNSFFKKILPKGLFYRSLKIVVTPIILLQIIITIVFFDSLWIKANKGMTRSLVGEVRTLFDVYKSNQENKKEILDLYNKNFDFLVSIKKNEIFPKSKEERLSDEIASFQNLWRGGFKTGYNKKRNQIGIEI